MRRLSSVLVLILVCAVFFVIGARAEKKEVRHGASILTKQPDLEPDIVIWFISNLPLAGYGLPPAIK